MWDSAVGLELNDIRRRRPFGTIDDVERYPRTFIERLEAFGLDSAVMHEYVISTILCDKSKTFCVIKPLYCSFCHF